MTSVGQPEVNGEEYQSHRHETSAHSVQTHGLYSLDSDLFSDPSHLISLALNGTDSHGISSRRRQERQRVYGQIHQDEVLNMLIDKEYEANRLMKVLRAALQRMNSQGTRISELERDNQEALERLRQINESRVQVQQQAARTEQELQLYRGELEHARRELVRGQDMIRILQQQRDEAERAAARARAKARKLRQQRLVDFAREEGRKWGFHDGYERAKQALVVGGTIDGPNLARYPTGHTTQSNTRTVETGDDVTSVRSSASEIIQQTEIRPPSVHSESAIINNHLDGLNDLQQSSSAPRLKQERLDPQLGGAQSTMPPTDEPTMLQPDARPGSTRTNMKSPGISVFRVDFADAQRELGENYNDHDHNFGKVPRRSWVTATQHNRANAPDPFHMNVGTRNRSSSDVSHVAKVQLNAQDEKKKRSWYRTFSLRKLGKRREIDPDPTQDKPPELTSVEAPNDNADEEEIYNYQRPPSMSWYQPKGSSLHASSKYRQSSVGSGSTSTHMSQLPLVNTPAVLFTHDNDMNVSTPSLSGRSTKEAGIIKKIKEKESLLSIIREDPLSRETTPMTERTFGGNRSKTSGIPRVASSSTMNSQALGGPLHSIAAAFSDPRNPQYIPYGKHKRSASEATPPVTIEVQTPSQSRTSSDMQRIRDELPNHFLSPSLRSQSLPRGPSVQRYKARDDRSSSRSAEAHKTPHQTSAMNIKEKYLAKTAAEETGSHSRSPGSSRIRELPGKTRPASRQNARGAGPAPSAAPHSPIYAASPNEQTLDRQMSSVSLRSMGSYSKFDPSTYVDPAFFEPNAEPRDIPTRPASSASHLSYVTDKR